MAKGIWLEVSRVQIEGNDVDVQVVGDKGDKTTNDRPEWWRVEPKAAGKDAQETFRTIAKGLDSTEQVVLARLGPGSGKGPELVCTAIRIQTK